MEVKVGGWSLDEILTRFKGTPYIADVLREHGAYNEARGMYEFEDGCAELLAVETSNKVQVRVFRRAP